MAEYKTRTTKLEAGQYQITYGRGGRKIVSYIWLNDIAGEDGGWQVAKDCPGFDALRDKSPFKRKKDLVEAWGEWAKQQYQEETPDPPKRTGPPKHKPSLKEKGPPKRRRKPKAPGWQAEAIDPFDPRFKYPSDHEPEPLRKKLTPLGVLCEIELAARSGVAVDKRVHTLVRECVAREAPDLLTEDHHVQSPTEKAQADKQARAEAGEDAGSDVSGGTEGDGGVDDSEPPFDNGVPYSK